MAPGSHARPRPPPKASLVVVGYNMARELPRTIRSLSPPLQRGVAAGDYEVIVVDNGSSEPIDEAGMRRWRPDLRLIRIADAGPSPAPAANQGIAAARAELIGVFIDGARMASPGIVAGALAAARLYPRLVVGTLGFHLGPDLHGAAVRQGYDRAAEDARLAACGWEEDGYRLFDISVLGKSSSRGWFVLPTESNAVFMTRAQWDDLGGYDEGFVTPGGGLCNLDVWARACADPAAEVVMLLGEATFHQLHRAPDPDRKARQLQVREEHQRLRGHPFQRPSRAPVLLGGLDHVPAETLRLSVERLAISAADAGG